MWNRLSLTKQRSGENCWTMTALGLPHSLLKNANRRWLLQQHMYGHSGRACARQERASPSRFDLSQPPLTTGLFFPRVGLHQPFSFTATTTSTPPSLFVLSCVKLVLLLVKG